MTTHTPICIQYYKTQVGELMLGSYQDQLCIADWRYRKMRTSIDLRIQTGLNTVYEERTSAVMERCQEQLEEYFSAKRRNFNIPLLLVGTEFQKKVWNQLLQIPFGKTETYLGLAKKMHNELAIRAVASANGANAVSIIIPCHRVIGSKGELTGYAGGLTAKKKLLRLEGGYMQQELMF
jgi:methylated-DNA-[protein]-cysteine S-methyltransferase